MKMLPLLLAHFAIYFNSR